MPYADVCSDGTRVLCAAPGEPPQVTFGDDAPIPCPDAGLYVSAEYVPSMDDWIAVAQGWQHGYLWVSRRERRAEIRHPAPTGTQCILVVSDGRILIATYAEQQTDGFAYFDYVNNVPVNMNHVIHHPPVHEGIPFLRAYRHYTWEIGQHPTEHVYLGWDYAAPGTIWNVGPSFGSPVQPKIRRMADGSAVAALTAGGGIFVPSSSFTPWTPASPPEPEPPPIIVVPPDPEPEPPPVIIVTPPQPEPPPPPRRPWWRVLLDYWFGGI